MADSPRSRTSAGVLVNPANRDLVGPIQRAFPNLTVREYGQVADVVRAASQPKRISYEPGARGQLPMAIGRTIEDEPPAKKIGRAPIRVTDTEANPSAAQAEAGNYLKGQVLDANGDSFEGLPIKVETKAGTERRDKAVPPKWRVTMRHHYGYIKRTIGADGDQVDVYVVRKPACWCARVRVRSVPPQRQVR
jgi:hypothetical protein